MSTLATARKALAAILKKRESIEATAEETRMLEHLQKRNELRETLQAEQLEAERSGREHAENLAALHAMGEKYTRQELDGIPEVRDELLRLSALVNKRRPRMASDAAERLILSCLDTDLQEQNRMTSENLQEAKRALKDARQQETKKWEDMSQAQRDILETLGSVSNQFGREGQRWRKIENESGVFVEAIDGQIHPQNIQFVNNNLLRPNRVILEGKSKDFGIERLTADIETLTQQLAVVHAAMAASDI